MSPSPSAQCVAPSGCSAWVRRTDLNSASSPPRDWYLSPGATFGLEAVLCALPVWTLSRMPLFVLHHFWAKSCYLSGWFGENTFSAVLCLCCRLSVLVPWNNTSDSSQGSIAFSGLCQVESVSQPSSLSLLMTVRFVFTQGSLVKWGWFSFVRRHRTWSCWDLLYVPCGCWDWLVSILHVCCLPGFWFIHLILDLLSTVSTRIFGSGCSCSLSSQYVTVLLHCLLVWI